jgi:hypothetical protein
MAENKRWIVTTSSDRPINEIAEDLKKAGFSIGRVMERVGSISGTAAEDIVTKLRSIPGVVHVSPDRPVAIGLPDPGTM